MAFRPTFDRGNGSLKRYLREIPEYTPTSDEVDPDAGKNADELILTNLQYVVRIAGGFRNRGVPFEDLLNEGNIGLIQAASRFDHGRGVRFSCYAAWWIRKLLRSALDEQGSTIRVPEYQRRKAAQLRSKDEAVRKKHGHTTGEPSCPDCSPQREAVRLHRLSLHSEGNDDMSGNLLDKISMQRSSDPLRELVARESRAGLRRGLEQLTPVEKAVIEGRFGLRGEKTRTLKELGASLGVSRERVRQIEVKAKEKLRTYMVRESGETPRTQSGLMPAPFTPAWCAGTASGCSVPPDAHGEDEP